MLVVFTNDSGITILSTIARLSGGTYDTLPEMNERWKQSGKISSRKEEAEFIQKYLTPLLLCGKPDSVENGRWFLKCLSNDQTAFTGFTSLVDVVDDQNIGYNGEIKLLPLAAFVEPFVLKALGLEKSARLLELRNKLRELDSTKVENVNEILQEAESLAPIEAGRKKGKSPLFFYSVTDQPFTLPASLYKRMRKATEIACDALATVSTKLNGSSSSLEKALFEKKDEIELPSQQFYTGSIDFMVDGDNIYLIDIGTPAVGYIADILFASEALGRKPEYGLEALARAAGEEIDIFRGNADELGFFELENKVLVESLRARGVRVNEVKSNGATVNGGEVKINGVEYPSTNFDYLSRNQPLRNRVLQVLPQLRELGVSVPKSVVTFPDKGDLVQEYDQMRVGEDYGILVKKKVFFREYGIGSGYFKPLVTPLWCGELRNDRKTSTLFEQFVPSLVDVDVAGDRKGKRCYEIRMYFCAGGKK